MILRIFILQLPVFLVLAESLPSFVKLCRKNDPDLGKCILNTANEILKHGHEPIPAMDLPILDPLHIETISVDTDGSAVKIHIDLIDCIFENFANLKCTELEAELENVKFSGKLFLPNLKAKSKYKMKGKILNFDIMGEGSLDFDSVNITMDADWNGNFYTKNGNKHIKLDKIETKTDIAEVKLHFSNFFGDNEVLTETVNGIINENIQDLKKDLDYIIEKTIGETSITFFNRVYSALSVDELFLD